MVNTKSQHAQYSSHWTCMASRLRHIFEFDGFPLICVVSLSYREIAIASPLRDPLNDPEASMSTESAPVCTHCTRNMLGTTFVSHTLVTPSPGKHQNIVKIVKNKKITLFPQPVTYRGKLAPKGPYENEKNVPEKPYMRGNAPIYTQCTW